MLNLRSFLPGSGRQLTESRQNITSKITKHSLTIAILNRTELSINACAEKVDDATTKDPLGVADKKKNEYHLSGVS